MNNSHFNKALQIIVLLTIIVIILYLLIGNFGYIENYYVSVPTGNIDIFEIKCECCNKTEDNTSDNKKEKKQYCKKVVKKQTEENNDTNQSEPDEPSEPIDFTAYDEYKIWDNETLRIFSNPAFEYKSIIAPGSTNSYTFVVRNNNDFDINVDIGFVEKNKNKVNMKYKLKNNDTYLVGSNNEYKSINNKIIKSIYLPAKSQESFILDWKWVDSADDAKAGFDINTTYKLTIQIGAY